MCIKCIVFKKEHRELFTHTKVRWLTWNRWSLKKTKKRLLYHKIFLNYILCSHRRLYAYLCIRTHKRDSRKEVNSNRCNRFSTLISQVLESKLNYCQVCIGSQYINVSKSRKIGCPAHSIWVAVFVTGVSSLLVWVIENFSFDSCRIHTATNGHWTVQNNL